MKAVLEQHKKESVIFLLIFSAKFNFNIIEKTNKIDR